MFIDRDIFDEIRKIIPIVCVDLVIPKNGDILLVKRIEPPAQGQWWTPGGRIFHGETIEKASIRKAKAEVHLDCRFKKILGVTESIFDNVIVNGKSISIHTVNVVCLMELKDDTQQIQLDNGHTDYLWTAESFMGLHPAVEHIFDLYFQTILICRPTADKQ
jgi:ADP-ribose pyrophosphatase YjhB (NUDIX family)